MAVDIATIYEIELYVDGGCLPTNPGPGGWAAILLLKGTNRGRCVYGSETSETTNNRMELRAIIEGFKTLKFPEHSNITVFSDSQWAINALKGTWKIKKNLDIIAEGKSLIDKIMHIKFEWVRGHVGNPMNEKCHLLVEQAITLGLKKETVKFEK